MIDNLIRNIKRYRLIRGMDQERIAGLLGISRVTYSKLENGKVSVSDDMFYRFSKILGVPTFALLDNPEPRCKRPLFRRRKPKTLQEKECERQMLIDAEHKFSDYEMLEDIAKDVLRPKVEFDSLRKAVTDVAEARALGSAVRDFFFRQGFNNVNRFAEAIEWNGIRHLPFDFQFRSFAASHASTASAVRRRVSGRDCLNRVKVESQNPWTRLSQSRQSGVAKPVDAIVSIASLWRDSSFSDAFETNASTWSDAFETNASTWSDAFETNASTGNGGFATASGEKSMLKVTVG